MSTSPVNNIATSHRILPSASQLDGPFTPTTLFVGGFGLIRPLIALLRFKSGWGNIVRKFVLQCGDKAASALKKLGYRSNA